MAKNGHLEGGVDGDTADAIGDVSPDDLIAAAGRMPDDLDVGVGSPDEAGLSSRMDFDSCGRS